MDGTFSSQAAYNDVKRALGHGYGIKIIYVYQDPKLAWRFTTEREKVEHRAISRDGFVNAYFETLSNVEKIMQERSERISLDLIIKDEYNKVKAWVNNITINEFDKNIKRYHNIEELEEYLND